MEDWTNLRGMSPGSAKEYILAHMTDLNLLKMRVKEADADAASWEQRASLARGKGLDELASQADARFQEARAKANALKMEAIALADDIKRMHDQVPGLEARVRSIDPDALLAELQLVTGEMDNPGVAKLEAEVKSAQADEALAALKASLGMAPPPEPAAPAASASAETTEGAAPAATGSAPSTEDDAPQTGEAGGAGANGIDGGASGSGDDPVSP